MPTTPPRSAHSWVSQRLTPILGVLLLWCAVTLVLVVPQPTAQPTLQLGDVSAHDVYAAHDFLDARTAPPLVVKRGQRLLQQGDVITEQHVALLALAHESQPHQPDPGRGLGAALAGAVMLWLGWFLLRALTPARELSGQRLRMMGLIAVGTLALTKLVLWSALPTIAIPLSVATMVTALLLNLSSAVVVTLTLAPLLGLLMGEHLPLLLLLLVGALGSGLAVSRARHRGQLLRAGAWIGLLHALGLASLNLWAEWPVTSRDYLWGLANGIGSSFIVMGVLPLFEHAFQVTTGIRLLELADLNHPLLKELVLKAPGTYHHSLIVGNLAEAACEAIGANALLARVGSYFHDVGKMEQAEYFIENQAGGDALHEKLTPAMSGLIITNHVRRGAALAKKAKLPQAIVDFIPQHHGTGVVFYFYHKAMERYDEAELAETDFRYEGPKPQSREAAVVLLADGVEASSRVLQGPTPARIHDLVRKIINARFIDGQLDECDLTLRDLTKIEEVFSRVLLGIHHTRIQYPEQEGDEADSSHEPAAQPARATPTGGRPGRADR